eukprot:scaffold165795_cov35-Prasinocladus_malaysianus.AAC.1
MIGAGSEWPQPSGLTLYPLSAPTLGSRWTALASISPAASPEYFLNGKSGALHGACWTFSR